MAAYTRKQYSGAARNTTTTTLLTNVGTTVDIAATTGWPSIAGIPFYVVISPSSIYEEKCLATISGSTLTLDREKDDTTASEHPIGSVIYPVFTANDADEANELVSKLTTTGDILTTDGANLLRLGVGEDGYFLKASSSASAGIEWASIPTINSLDDVGDVTITTVEDGDFLTYNSSASVWVNETIHFLTVSDTEPTDEVQEGDLWYNSSELELYTYYSNSWVQLTLTPEFPTVEELDNVYIDAASANDVLAFDGLNWYNDTVSNLLGSNIIALSGDVSGSVLFDGSASVNISTTIQPNSVALGTDTTGNYMSDLAQGTGVTITHTPSEGSNATIGIGQDVATTASVSFAKVTAPLTGNVIGNVTGNSDTASSLETSRTIALSGDVSGSVSFNGSSDVSISATIQPNSVALGTDTTGNYMSDLTQGTGVTITHTPGEGSNATIAIGQAVATSSSVSFARVETTGDVVVGGNLTVNGTTTTLNTETLLVEDNIVVLNSGITASPTLNSGIEVERGTSDNVSMRWNESTDRWEFTNDGSAYNNVLLKSDISLNDISDTVITSAANGQLLEFDGTNWVNAVRPSSEPIGHENKADSVISFDEGSLTFSIAPVSGSYTVWCAGKRYVKTGTETVQIPDTSGLYYIYFNSSGVLAYRTTFFVWDTDAPTAYIYWNEVDNKAYFFGDERHGITLDWATHEYLHRTRGAAIANGFGANNYILNGNGSSDTHAKIDIANGTFFDEDLQVDITHSATPTANTWEQVLQGNAEIPVFYRLNNHWTKDVATEFPLKQGTDRPQYNPNTAGTWSTEDVQNNHFGVSWIIATNNLNEPVIAILGQASYTNNGSAQAEFYTALNLDGFPIVEFRPLYKIIYECKTSYTNTPSARITDVIDLRSVVSSEQGVGATPVSDHGSMTGLGDDDHTQYLTDARHDALDHTTAIGSASLDDIGNVSASAAASGDFLKYDGANWVNDPINLGTDTVGNYMSDLTQGTGVTITHTPGEGSNATIGIGQDVATSSSVTFANVTSTGNVAISGRIDKTTIRESVADTSVSAGVVTADYSTGDIFYVGTAPSSNFTVNLTNAPTDDGKAVTVVLFVTQGATGYIPNAVQVAGSAQTIKWANGAAPTPTSSAGKIDIFSFTFVRRSSAWTVFGSSNLGY